MQQYTAEYLNSLPALKQAEAVAAFVSRVAGKIIDAATKGYTAYVYEEKHYANFSNNPLGPHLLRRPSLEELAVAFQAQFPDCKIEIQDNWVDVRPGVREQRSQILIDWTPPGKSMVVGKLNTAAISAM
jgi:hypothetical protein